MSKELEAFERIKHDGDIEGNELYHWMSYNDIDIVENGLKRLESIDNSTPSEALKSLESVYYGSQGYGDIQKHYEIVKQALLKAQEQEKENELLKEIIKSLFDRGCPLHQYTDSEGVLTIEVDDECSIMRLGEFKGVDLDKKLKEVLE